MAHLRTLLILLALFLMVSCVSQNTATSYAQRAYPDCSNFTSLNHSYSSGDQSNGSQTEVSMVCGEAKKSITVKCIHGWGIFSDTTCHENN